MVQWWCLIIRRKVKRIRIGKKIITTLQLFQLKLAFAFEIIKDQYDTVFGVTQEVPNAIHYKDLSGPDTCV